MSDAYDSIRAFSESAASVFQFQGPVYEFSFCPTDDSVPTGTLGWPDTLAYGVEPDEEVQIDRMEDLVHLPFPDDAARTVICVNTLEHVFEPHQAFSEMIRILAPGGILLVSSPIDGPFARRPDQYWRPTVRAVQRLLVGLEGTLIAWQGADESPHTVFAIGCKPPATADFIRGTRPFMDRFRHHLEEEVGRAGWFVRLGRLLTDWTRTPEERQYRREFHNLQFLVDLPAGSQLKDHLLGDCLPSSQPGSRLDLEQ